jgi:hypothetical protein
MEFAMPTRDWEALTLPEKVMIVDFSKAVAAAFAHPENACWVYGPHGVALLGVPLECAPGPESGGEP